MSEPSTAALAPTEQREIDFYDDRIVAVVVTAPERAEPEIYVPIRPICDNLGVDWSGQRQRINRDSVLAEAARIVGVTPTNRGGNPNMLALPVDLLHGWLFGISENRVKPEFREKLQRYRRECFRVLWRAFQAETIAAAPSTSAFASVAQVREFGLAMARLAEEHLALDARVSTTEERLDQAATVVSGLLRDVAQTKNTVAELARRVDPGATITETQAGDLQQRVKALALLLTEKDPSKNHFQSIWGELNRHAGVSGYRNVPATRYPDVVKLLEDWRERASQRALPLDTAGE